MQVSGSQVPFLSNYSTYMAPTKVEPKHHRIFLMFLSSQRPCEISQYHYPHFTEGNREAKRCQKYVAEQRIEPRSLASALGPGPSILYIN